MQVPKAAWSKANFGKYRSLIAQQMRENNHVYFYKIAVSYYLNGEFRESERYLAQALELQNNFSSAYILKGKIAGKQGNSSQAISHYQRAVDMEKNPSKKAKMYQMVANLQLRNNDNSGALSSLDKAMRSDPSGSSASMLYMKAKAEYGSGRFSETVNTLETLLRSGVDTKAKARYSFMLGMACQKDPRQ